MRQILSRFAVCGFVAATVTIANMPQGSANPVVHHQLQAPRTPVPGGVKGDGGSAGGACKPLMTPGQCIAMCKTLAGFAFANHQGSEFDMSKCLSNCNSTCK